MKQLPLNLLSSSVIATTVTLISCLVATTVVQASALPSNKIITSTDTLTTESVDQVRELPRRRLISTIPHIPEDHPGHDNNSASQQTMLVSFALIVSSIAATAAHYRKSD